MTGAIERKLGASAAECFKYILKQMYERTDPWQRVNIFILHLSNQFNSKFVIHFLFCFSNHQIHLRLWKSSNWWKRIPAI